MKSIINKVDEAEQFLQIRSFNRVEIFGNKIYI